MARQQLIRFDWAMKNILRDKANFGVLEGFLSELLGTDIHILEILESESNRPTEKDKMNRVDLMVQTQTGERIIIEVQCEKQVDYLSRILFGTSKVIAETLEKGCEYLHVKKVVSVTIAYFDLGHGDDYVYRGSTRFEGIHTHHVLQLSPREKQLYQKEAVSDIYPQYYIIRVNSFDQETQDSLDEWIYFLKNEKLPKNYKAKGLKEAAEKLDVLKLSGQERRAYDRYLESLMDRASFYQSTYGEGLRDGEKRGLKKGLAEGEKRGRKEGQKEGEQRKAIEIARQLLQSGVDKKMITRTTGLSAKQLKALS
ncbi:MAG: Rpn family recombination-promoting nuclease/putative transposase [Myxococcota bacterium]